MNDLETLLKEQLLFISQKFEDEIEHSDNKDYRLGYYAGVLYALLTIKSIFNEVPDLTQGHH